MACVDLVKFFECVVAGELGADQGTGQTQEPEGAPKAHAEDTPTLETEAGAQEADPGEPTVQKFDSTPTV